jgi:hypothetical protein
MLSGFAPPYSASVASMAATTSSLVRCDAIATTWSRIYAWIDCPAARARGGTPVLCMIVTTTE